MELHFADVFEALADALPHKTCIVQAERKVSWQEFDQAASRLAAAFHHAGLRPGEKVGIYLYNSPEWLVTFFAALKIRAVPVTINYRYVDEELGYLLDDCEAAVVVYDASFARRMAAVSANRARIRLLIQVGDAASDGGPPEAASYTALQRDLAPHPRERRDPTDSLFIYTGGTTGMPKGLPMPIGSMCAAMLRGTIAMNMLGLDRPPGEDFVDFAIGLHDRSQNPIACPAAPLMHGAGLNLGALPVLCVGGTVAFLSQPSFDAEALVRAIEAQRIGSAVIVGDAMARPLAYYLGEARARGVRHDLTSLRILVSSGVAITADAQSQLFEQLPDVVIVDQAGSTEGGLGHRRITRDNYRDGPGFIPFPGVRVLRPDDTDVEPGSGERGLLACPTAIGGYFNDSKKSAEVFREIEGKRYAVAGDWATVGADGTITLLGRDTSIINTGGEKVFAEEVEGLIGGLPGVRDCLVVGTPDERFGKAVTAVVSLRDPALVEATIIADLRGRLAGYKIPRRFVFVGDVPRLPTGKPDRAAATALADAELTRTESGGRRQGFEEREFGQHNI